jgi:hypothetical protein
MVLQRIRALSPAENEEIVGMKLRLTSHPGPLEKTVFHSGEKPRELCQALTTTKL